MKLRCPHTPRPLAVYSTADRAARGGRGGRGRGRGRGSVRVRDERERQVRWKTSPHSLRATLPICAARYARRSRRRASYARSSPSGERATRALRGGCRAVGSEGRTCSNVLFDTCPDNDKVGGVNAANEGQRVCPGHVRMSWTRTSGADLHGPSVSPPRRLG